MFAQTKREVLVEYPLDVVYDTFVSIFPVKYYNLGKEYPQTHSFMVVDSFNSTFVMHVGLRQNTSHTTLISFMADYPHAAMDLTGGGTQAIETVLEELLKQLDKLPKTGNSNAVGGDVEVVNADNFVNTSKNKTHKFVICIGYVLCVLSLVPALIALVNYDPDNFVMFILFIVSVLALSVEISLSIVLQYYENFQSILHGRIQLCICGLVLIFMGILIHPGLAVAGMAIPTVALFYLIKREKYGD